MMSQDDKNTSVFPHPHIDRSNWKRVRLGDLVARQTISMGRGNVISKEAIGSDPGAYPVFSSSATGDGIIGYYARYMFEDERISWSIDGGGRFFYHPASRYSVTNVSGWIKVHKPAEINTRYLYLALDAEWKKKHFDYQTKAHPSVIKNEYIIAYPDIDTQNKIATVIASCDDYITAIQSLITKYEAIKKATVNLLLKPKAGWQRIRLDDCCMCLDNMRKPVNEEMRQSMKGDIPYCGANGIVDYVNDYTINDSVILIAEDGGYFDEYQTRSIAYMIIGKAWVNNHAHILKVKNGYCQDYIFHTLEHKNIVPFITSGTRAKLTKRELLNIEINAPESVYEQRKIAAQISAIDNALNDCRAQLAKAQSLKQGMMSYFFG